MDLVLYFQDAELVQTAKALLGDNEEKLSLLTRDTYLSYLELDYEKRVAEEHEGEIGLFGRVDAPSLVDAPTSLDDYLANRMVALDEDESILKNIDKEIKQITDSQQNDQAKRKNLKPTSDHGKEHSGEK